MVQDGVTVRVITLGTEQRGEHLKRASRYVLRQQQKDSKLNQFIFILQHIFKNNYLIGNYFIAMFEAEMQTTFAGSNFQ